MIAAGIDAGSRTLKIVLVQPDDLSIVASGTADQGINQSALAKDLFDSLLRDSHIERDDVSGIIATGYGRYAVDFADKAVTEITCHAAGVRHLVADARTVIDIGGQDSKLIRLDSAGAVQDFAMNDRCAAGTGCFLEVVARRLETPLESLGELAARSASPAAISSMCVVFAETEIIGLLASGASREDIVAGVQLAIARRLTSMAGRSVDEPVIFTGGVALVPGMQTALETVLQKNVRLAPHPQLTGALGAALLAARQINPA